MSTGSVDHDGDVKMSVAQPVYEYIRAPMLTKWSQPAIVHHIRDWIKYEDKLKERCAVTGEALETVILSKKSSLIPRVLDHVACFILKKDVFDVTDAELWWLMQSKVGSMLNGYVPDVEKIVDDQLRMDLRETDIAARIATYWMDFDEIVEINDLQGLMGRKVPVDEHTPQRVKLRCKLLMRKIEPEVVRVEIMRLAELTHPYIKRNEMALYDLLVEKATRQQQSHLMQLEVKHAAGKKKNDEKPTKDKGKQDDRAQVGKGKPAAIGGSTPTRGQQSPPKDGCLICKKAHWVRDCPSATAEQKEEALRRLKSSKIGLAERTKVVRTLVEATGGGEARVAVINNVLEVPFCPDTGSDSNIVSRRIVNELVDLDATTVPIVLEQPVVVMVAGGGRMECHESVTVDLTIQTAAGPLHLRNVWCLVLEGQEDEFLLGRRTMKEIGIKVDGMLEELAGRSALVSAEFDDLGDGDPLANVDGDIKDALTEMVDDAMAAGFDPELRGALEHIVFKYADVWRLRLGLDPPARVEPMRVLLTPDASPYRSTSRKYPDMQRAFLREYVRDLEANGLIERNNASRWASAAHPVRKQGSDEYRITVDYRQVNATTVPLAGTTPNLAAVTQSVRGAYGFGQFDFSRLLAATAAP